MKSDLLPSVVQMEAEVLRNLVNEVKETVATDLRSTGNIRTNFGVVDLWNIQRNRKSAQRMVRRNQC
jgi:hypothetical protein